MAICRTVKWSRSPIKHSRGSNTKTIWRTRSLKTGQSHSKASSSSQVTTEQCHAGTSMGRMDAPVGTSATSFTQLVMKVSWHFVINLLKLCSSWITKRSLSEHSELKHQNKLSPRNLEARSHGCGESQEWTNASHSVVCGWAQQQDLRFSGRC